MKVLHSLRIPITVLIIGFCWAALSNPIITFFFRHISLIQQDVYRSLNDLVFVFIISIVLYVKINKQHRKLIKSEEQYRQLFEANPTPLWIYNEKTLRFVNVNNAAIEKYGFSRRRFLKMTINDIRIEEDHDKLMDYLNAHEDSLRSAGEWKHVKATGDIFDVSIISYPVLFNKQKCTLVMATDITDLLEKERKLEEAHRKLSRTNQTLLQIAWSNSHELRRPLCSIMSLVSLLKEAHDQQENQEFLNLLDISSTELDMVLRSNNEKVNEIEMQEAI